MRGFDEGAWTAASSDLVYAGSHAKLTQHAALRDAPEATGSATLVEASPSDRIGGIGLAASSTDASRRARWRGRNRLGAVLTSLRDDLRSGPWQPRVERALALLHDGARA